MTNAQSEAAPLGQLSMKKLDSPVWAELIAIIALFSLIGCGGHAAPRAPAPLPPPTPRENTSLLVYFGDLESGTVPLPPGWGATDAYADQVISLNVEITSLVLKRTDGSETEVLSSPIWAEFAHRQGRPQPALQVSIPQGVYSSAVVRAPSATTDLIQTCLTVPPPCFRHPHIATSYPFDQVIDFPPVALSSSPASLQLDLDFRHSVTDQDITPMFAVIIKDRPAMDKQEPGTGAVTAFIGRVTKADSTSIELSEQPGGSRVSFLLDSSTFFYNMRPDELTADSVLNVSALSAGDGTLHLTRVELLAPPSLLSMSGLKIGPCTQSQCGGNSFSQLAIQQIHSNVVVTPPVYTYYLQLAPDVTFSVESQGTDMGKLPFTPRFDPSTLTNVQTVEVSIDPLTTGSNAITAHSVKLYPQALAGVVSQFAPANSGATFILNTGSPPFDFGVFSTLAFEVYPYVLSIVQQPSTTVTHSIQNGDIVRVFGLLFFDGSGSYTMVANRIDIL